MVASKAAQQLTHIISSWPVDPFRPNIQLKNFLKSLSAHPKLTPQAVQAAQLLRDNAIQKKYALSTKTLQPESMPKHYERLVEGYERSARGAGRSWWKIFFGVWK
ncbi:hypothetical protein K503DRAFT_741219 [Rhizopogon vinicolor AM-OR11-026]|uniref:Uncharacterized protein n=1 Tax=Rhizopogon vinicolor AM-OR11-026 TaxID=1314800 RepID=A0A1B7N0N1_9AGAM|nr:hypothetical protein K503DRAFT_741219 [Rhizopogon vinicolor AM-OR11-026]